MEMIKKEEEIIDIICLQIFFKCNVYIYKRYKINVEEMFLKW